MEKIFKKNTSKGGAVNKLTQYLQPTNCPLPGPDTTLPGQTLPGQEQAVGCAMAEAGWRPARGQHVPGTLLWTVRAVLTGGRAAEPRCPSAPGVCGIEISPGGKKHAAATHPGDDDDP